MATIHVNTEQMRQLGQVFVQNNDQLHQSEGQIQNYIGQLEGDWQGVSRQRFEQMFQEWRAAADRIVSQGEEIGRHLQNTAQQFENVDSQS
jgi:WXG100 family type VII secretion target